MSKLIQLKNKASENLYPKLHDSQILEIANYIFNNYIFNNKEDISDKVTFQKTDGTGEISSYKAYKVGRLIFLTINIHIGSHTNLGGVSFRGTCNLRPMLSANGAGASGNSIMTIGMETGGEIVSRVFSSAIDAGTYGATLIFINQNDI